MPRYQVGSVRKEKRAEGLTWVLRYYATRADGKRVERTTAIGLVNDVGSTAADVSEKWIVRSCAKPSTNYSPS
jgi:hypothetical protein